jgi:signal transduction histidine kinase
LILLDNAVKYTPAGGRIDVTVREHGESAVGEVCDSGIGIASDDLPHVFDRFYRADRARSREHGGAGLGLAIARWIAESHGGAISVASEVERGSRFEVRLPLT